MCPFSQELGSAVAVFVVLSIPGDSGIKLLPSDGNINQPAAPDPLTALAVSLVPISCFSHGQDVSFLLNRQCCTPTLTFKQPKFRASTRTALMATRLHHLVVCQETHRCDSESTIYLPEVLPCREGCWTIRYSNVNAVLYTCGRKACYPR